MPPETFEDFYSDITELAGKHPEVAHLKGFSKTYISGADATGLRVSSRAGGKTGLVPRTLFMVLWNALTHSDELNREALEEEHNLTRVLFLMSFCSKLDYIEYSEGAESIRLVR